MSNALNKYYIQSIVSDDIPLTIEIGDDHYSNKFSK